jgi:type IX secretion system PorP/SprF family membrane protein
MKFFKILNLMPYLSKRSLDGNLIRRYIQRICVSGIALLLPLLSYAQADIHFSQFYETSILRNPALTGVFSDDYKVGVYYRNQWSSITTPYSTGLISAESHLPISQTSEDFVSFGILGYEDKAGSIDQTIVGFYPAINYNKSIDPNHNTFLSAGFTGGYIQYSFNPSLATFNNQYVNGSFSPNNPTMENLPNPSLSMWDLGAGLNFNTSSGVNNNVTYIIGFSGYHFTEPKFSYYQSDDVKEYIRLNGNGAIGFSLNDIVSMQFQANYATEGTYREIIFGGMVNWTGAALGEKTIFVLSGGLYYRYQDAIIPVVKVTYKSMAIGVSYDVNVSTLRTASDLAGGYEMTLFITGNYSDKGITKRTVCPKF